MSGVGGELKEKLCLAASEDFARPLGSKALEEAFHALLGPSLTMNRDLNYEKS